MEERPAVIPAIPAAISSPPGAAPRPTLTLDVALYEGYLADRGLDAAQKQALLEALWSIIVGFVDLGFAVEPAAPLADRPGAIREEFAEAADDLVGSNDRSTTGEFANAAVHGPHECEKRGSDAIQG